PSTISLAKGAEERRDLVFPRCILLQFTPSCVPILPQKLVHLTMWFPFIRVRVEAVGPRVADVDALVVAVPGAVRRGKRAVGWPWSEQRLPSLAVSSALE